MTLKLRYISIGFTIAAIFVSAMSLFYVAKANPSFFIRKQSASATTTVTYMTAGVGTSTLTIDLGAGGAQGADSAVLLQQFVGSTTAATLVTAFEVSQGTANVDCTITPTLCDWYGLTATSTPALGNAFGGGIGLSSTTARAIQVSSPTRYIRAVFSIPPAGISGAVWAEFVGKRQNP